MAKFELLEDTDKVSGEVIAATLDLRVRLWKEEGREKLVDELKSILQEGCQ